MNIITKGTKGCVKMSLNENLFDDIWSSGVKIAEEVNVDGIYYCRNLKTSYKVFCLAMLEKSTKESPEGSYPIMRISLRVPGDKPLIVIGYNYISQKVLGLIYIEGSRSTEPGVTYLSFYPENFLLFPFTLLFVLT